MQITIDVGSSLKFIGVALLAALVLYVFWTIFSRIRRFFISRSFDAGDRESLRRRWKEIEAMLEQPGEMSRKLAIIEADKLLDAALKALAMPGTTLGERLRFAQYKYPKLREVWGAHKIRNQLAHEASYHLDSFVARRALKDFERALTYIGAI
jgi:hypothetical protein